MAAIKKELQVSGGGALIWRATTFHQVLIKRNWGDSGEVSKEGGWEKKLRLL